jgi:hypothetical protein
MLLNVTTAMDGGTHMSNPVKLFKFNSKEDISEWVSPDDYFPGINIAITGTLKCPECSNQEWIAIPYDDVTMLLALRFEAIDFPERKDEVIVTLQKFVDNITYFTSEEKNQFMWGFCNNSCLSSWVKENPLDE